MVVVAAARELRLEDVGCVPRREQSRSWFEIDDSHSNTNTGARKHMISEMCRRPSTIALVWSAHCSRRHT
jgi:hypothetical protein